MIGLRISLILLVLSIGVFDFDNTFAQSDTPNVPKLDFEINQFTTDKQSYRYGETIIVSGNIDSKYASYPGQIQLDISIAGSVYPYEISVDRNGDFTFKIVAGGPEWTKTGTYSLGLLDYETSYGAYLGFEYILPGPPRGTYIETDKNLYYYSPSSSIFITGNLGGMQLPITLLIQCDAAPDQIKKVNIDKSFGQFYIVDNYGNFEYVIGTFGFGCNKQTTTGIVTIQGTNISTSFLMSVQEDVNNESEIIASTDKISYQKGDSIIFSGKVTDYEFGKKVNYEITGPNGFVLFMNQIEPNSDGSFSHTFAEFASWAYEGEYTIKYYYDNFMNNANEVTYNYSTHIVAEPISEPIPEPVPEEIKESDIADTSIDGIDEIKPILSEELDVPSVSDKEHILSKTESKVTEKKYDSKENYSEDTNVLNQNKLKIETTSKQLDSHTQKIVKLLDSKISGEQSQYDEYYKQFQYYEEKSLSPKEGLQFQKITEKLNAQNEKINSLVDERNKIVSESKEVTNIIEEVIEDKVDTIAPIKPIEEEPQKQMTCFLFWCW